MLFQGSTKLKTIESIIPRLRKKGLSLYNYLNLDKGIHENLDFSKGGTCQLSAA